MKKDIINVIKSKQNIYIICWFLFFFPLKTQLDNGLMLVFDLLFRNGITSAVFNYNYTGTFTGCEKIKEIVKANLYFNWFQKHGIYWIKFLPSLFAFIFLFKRWKKDNYFKNLDWFLIIIACFSILTSLNDLISLLFYFDNYSSEQILRLLPTVFVFLSIGAFIFFKIFNFKERLQAIIFGILGFYGSFFLWMQFLGPKILPIIH
ncbi:MAG: hypothetical protein V3V28_10790 [Polaribacter sp.]|uniref:hypothetical protein n=1 Tax=Polaribacter sp. TaxID=1920175 RepID=UPI002F35BB73